MAISMKKAIAEKCKDCIYDPLSGLGTWLQQVTGCTSPNCALYPFRPVSSKSEEARVRKAEWYAQRPGYKPPANGFKRRSTATTQDPLP